MNYKKHIKVFISVFVIFFTTISISEAKKGCCSRHGGVCGCRCCDETPLSVKCAAYYSCGEDKKISEYDDNANRCEASVLKVKITYVVDGDTVEFICENKQYRVRLIGIDTPEIVRWDKPVEAFGREASEKMRNIVLNRTVILKTTNQNFRNKDKHGRLLRYVFLDGEDIGSTMIKNGYAFSYKSNNFSHDKFELYNRLEQEAKKEGAGLWEKYIPLF